MSQFEEESRASRQQAKLMLQAAINSSLAGEDEEALTLFDAARQRFTELKMTLDAGIAGAWISGLKKHNHSPA